MLQVVIYVSAVLWYSKVVQEHNVPIEHTWTKSLKELLYCIPIFLFVFRLTVQRVREWLHTRAWGCDCWDRRLLCVTVLEVPAIGGFIYSPQVPLGLQQAAYS